MRELASKKAPTPESEGKFVVLKNWECNFAQTVYLHANKHQSRIYKEIEILVRVIFSAFVLDRSTCFYRKGALIELKKKLLR